jgi:Xaa-Pro aminopeptidase
LNRVDALRKAAFSTGKFDGYTVFNGVNLVYLAGFRGASALLVPRDGESVLYVYGVNYEMAKAESAGLRVELIKRGENLTEKIAKQAIDCGVNQLTVDSLGITGWQSLAKSLGNEKKLAVDNGIVQELRKVKDEKEVKLLRKAAELTSLGMKVAYETVKAGLKEYEAAAEIEYAMRKKGSGGTAFETIVASGACSAFPHGGCSDRVIRNGDLVVVDIGAAYKGYCSDMTRTLAAGKASEKQKRLYEIVKRAQDRAFEALKPGAKARDVDAAARQTIADAGYSEYFVHGLGHGVGLEVHEPPTLSPDSEDVLAAGNVVTVEPGVYLVGYGGIRIEDTVLVGESGGKKLTSGPYTLGAE